MPVDLLALFTKGIWVRSQPRPSEDILMPIDVEAVTQQFAVDVSTLNDVFAVDIEFIED